MTDSGKKWKNPTIKNMTSACAKQSGLLVFLGFFTNILMLTVPIYMMQIYDRVLVSHSHTTLFYLTLMAVIAILTFSILETIRSRILIHISIWIDKSLSPEALSSSADELLQGRSYGSQSLQDINHIRQFIASPAVFALLDIPYAPIYLIAIFLLHAALGTLILIGAIILFGIAIINELVTRNLLLKANTLAVHNQRYADTGLRNAEVMMAMGMMPAFIHQWSKKNTPVLELQTLASEKSAYLLGFTKFFRILLQILVLGIGAYYVTQGEAQRGRNYRCFHFSWSCLIAS